MSFVVRKGMVVLPVLVLKCQRSDLVTWVLLPNPPFLFATHV